MAAGDGSGGGGSGSSGDEPVGKLAPEQRHERVGVLREDVTRIVGPIDLGARVQELQLLLHTSEERRRRQCVRCQCRLPVPTASADSLPLAVVRWPTRHYAAMLAVGCSAELFAEPTRVVFAADS
jgi:hypothetical protein